MGKFREVDGDLISLAKSGAFDVICQGVNAFCCQKSGLAPQMVTAFRTDKFPMESPSYRGDYNKLGQIDYKYVYIIDGKGKFGAELRNEELTPTPVSFAVVNCYTQYNYGRNHADGDKAPFDYTAFRLCMRKINHVFKGKHIGLPLIGCGLASGDEKLVIPIMKTELYDCDTTLVRYKK